MREETMAWLSKAKEDLEIAKYNLKGKKIPAAAFYSQQAAEKALKAVQIEKLKRFDRTHDLFVLAHTISAPIKLLEACKALNPLYTGTRYPDASEIHTLKDIQEKVKLAKEVVKWASQILKS